ncbi:MAG: septal ring lytic transglycosylase RlpA family protein [Sphingobacteriales bacterium]|jgi:rare lipoprotein A|nr:septal ring lytic transglycosylase RlpA family protein [Sphingobacteriales bacterium]MBP9140682.1 septal ring lytic transglycosylase RlpA family protein [Chitinophagales bacterium]MDA0198895.1 septal ring lytic transglycosylase RlpA family protein [Bacteroidota bacterium]MBK6889114.1 septal ring lytic transglycosylase RlpA family protein [Sphingobacteriales bacterium]MBK7528384.1 septal ring lytic transglycosylase RlpA family protein [Sphingobacteriales bacterium]
MKLYLIFVFAIILLTANVFALTAQEGNATYYHGPEFHGKKTASGEYYDQYAATAAHKTFPYGTVVRVTRKDNGKSVLARINDRCAGTNNTVIDLSRRLATELGILIDGSVPVKVEKATETEKSKFLTKNPKANLVPPAALSPGVDGFTRAKILTAINLRGDYYIQIGNFNASHTPQRAADLMADLGYINIALYDTKINNVPTRKVLVGPYSTEADALVVRRAIEKNTNIDCFIVNSHKLNIANETNPSSH